jgi:hypothetical protein
MLPLVLIYAIFDIIFYIVQTIDNILTAFSETIAETWEDECD